MSNRENAAVCVDVAILSLKDGKLQVLLNRRDKEPYVSKLALPGGYLHLDKDKSLEDAAYRILKSKVDHCASYLEQLGTYGSPDRDPRGWAVTVVYFALVPYFENKGDVSEWCEVDKLPNLAFDHNSILAEVVARVKAKVEYTSLATYLLPDMFTIPEIHSVFEQILGRHIDKVHFRRNVLSNKIIEEVKGALKQSGKRPAQLYRATNKPVYLGKTI